MATRCYIVDKLSETAFEAIYCHWDGYPEGVGATLASHYKTDEKVEELIRNGDLSSLGDTIKESSVFYSDTEIGHPASVHKTFEEVLESAKNVGCEYVYVFAEGVWNTHEISW